MSFPLFASLPREIQDQIWAYTIPHFPPTAHLVKLKTQRWTYNPSRSSPRTETTLHRVYDPDVAEPEFMFQATRDAMRVLHNTCRASRAVSQRTSRVTGMKTTLLRATLRDRETAVGPSLPPLRVNIAADLILAHPSWHHHVPVYLPVAYGRPRHMALEFPNPDLKKSKIGVDFENLVKMYYDLVVAYVLIEPQDLVVARDTSWPDDAEAVEALEGFIAAYDSVSKGPGPWLRGRREYYEIPKEEVRELGGLRWVVGVLDAIRRRISESGKLDYDAVADRSKHSTRHRLMSWRNVE